MRRFRDWLYNKFLPWETKKIYQQEVDSLRKAFDAQQARINELEAYINGMHEALKQRVRININNEVGKSENG